MKKFTIYFLCVLFCMGILTACAGNDDNNTKVTATPGISDTDSTGTGSTSDTTVIPTESPAASATPTEAPDDNDAPTVTDTSAPDGEDGYEQYDAYGECCLGFYPYSSGTDQQDIHTPEPDDRIVGHVSIPVVEYYGPVEKIGKAVEEMNASFRDTGTRQCSSIKELLPYMTEDELENAEEYNYYYEGKFHGVRSDKDLFSGILEDSFYTGGAHGYTGYGAINISGLTGEYLTLSDVFTDKEKLAEVLVAEIREAYPDTSFFDLEETVKQEVEEERIEFLVGYTGVSFLFSPYEIASFADGLLTVSLPFNKYGDIISDSVKAVPDVMNMELTTYVPYFLDVDGDGEEDRLELSLNINFEEYSAGDFKYYVEYADRLDVTVNNKKVLSHQFEEYSYDEQFFLMQNENGEMYFYIKSACASEDYSVEGYKCEKGKFTGIDNVAENLQGSIAEIEGWGEADTRIVYLSYIFNPYSIPVVETTDVVGTVQTRTDSHIDSDGYFAPWSVKSDFIGEVHLTTLQDITCTRADESGFFLEENITLPAGTELEALWTAGNQGVLFKNMASEEYYYVDFAFRDYHYYVNDNTIEEIFEGIQYAD